jgi:hypothetical protein
MAKTAVIVVVAYGRYFLPFTLSNTKPVTGNRKVARFATSSSCLFLSSFIKKCYFNGKKKYLPSSCSYLFQCCCCREARRISVNFTENVTVDNHFHIPVGMLVGPGIDKEPENIQHSGVKLFMPENVVYENREPLY